MARKHVLIVGGGFAGIKTALELVKCKEYAVTLLSNEHEFRYYPALYRSATGGTRSISAIPLADIFAGKQITIEYGEAKLLDRQHKAIRTREDKDIAYDILVLALGVTTNYFGIEGLEKYSFGIKTLEDAERLKQHLHQQLIDGNKPDYSYIVVGGGPTGIELAGELPRYLQRIMHRHGADGEVHIDLVEAAPRLLPRMPEDVSVAVAKRLQHLGVKLYLGETVKAATADTLMIHNDQAIKTHTIIWTAGMANSAFYKINGFTLSPKGRVVVDEFMQAEPDLYVLGDNAETPYTGMAQTALHDALYVANRLKQLAKGRTTTAPYKAKSPIYVVPAGPHWAAVLWGGVRLYGWLGWILRRLADLVAYHDIEPWWRASKLWMAESAEEEDCAVCGKENGA